MRQRLILAMMLALDLPSAPAMAEPAGPPPQFVTLVAGDVADDKDQLCTADRQQCFSASMDDGAARLSYRLGTGDAQRDGQFPLPVSGGDDRSVALWEQALTIPASSTSEAPQLLVGIAVTDHTMYSGGGGSATRLHLFALSRPYGSPVLSDELLDIAWDSNKMIRACFSEQDMRDRAGACHDEYAAKAELRLAADAAAGPAVYPDLAYRYRATTYPGGVSLDKDSLERGRLRKRDLVWTDDPECSFDRRLRYNPTTRRYEADQPGPDCSDYDVP